MDVKLSDGRGLRIDLSQITMLQFRSVLDPAQDAVEGDTIIGKCVGMTAEELGALPLPDYKRLVRAFFRKAREPLADPKGPSESTPA